MLFPSRSQVEAVKKSFPVGMRVECVQLDDPYTSVYPGEKGTVSHVDDTGTIHVRWDNGRMLGAILGVDYVRAIKEEAKHDDADS